VKKSSPPKKMTKSEAKAQALANSKAIRGNAAVCANCGAIFEQGDLGILSDCIMKDKPTCSHECNKALGQVKE